MPEAEGQCEVCQQPSKQKCSQCKLVFYCSSEHQKENWTSHKSSCIPYEVCLKLLILTNLGIHDQFILFRFAQVKN